MKIVLLSILLFIQLAVSGQSAKPYPAAVEGVLKKAGENRPELEKVIAYFQKSGDLQKMKAIYFLIANMDIHYSATYYWADSLRQKVVYNELDYPDFGASVRAFEDLKLKTPGLHPVPVRLSDITHIKAGFLIDHVEKTFQTWRSSIAKNIPFKDFCEYILPYRVSVEPLQNWQQVYAKKFQWISDSIRTKGLTESLFYVSEDCKKWFVNTNGVEKRREPLPRLGPLQLLLRQKGACEDVADLEVFALRSQGIPSSVTTIPYWATSTGSHFVNTVFDAEMRPIQFDVLKQHAINDVLAREPAKVLQTTYSKQSDVLAAIAKQEDIPDGFLRTLNYRDITDQYWITTDVSCELFKSASRFKIAYACVFNGLAWKPTWWGAVKDDSVVFKKMSKGAVFLPAYYVNGKLSPAGHPVAAGYNRQFTLVPDTLNKRRIKISEQENYLLFRPGKSYKLYYWDKGWKLAGEKKAEPALAELVFEGVPLNALLLLLPEYSQGKERPFIITDKGERLWW